MRGSKNNYAPLDFVNGAQRNKRSSLEDCDYHLLIYFVRLQLTIVCILAMKSAQVDNLICTYKSIYIFGGQVSNLIEFDSSYKKMFGNQTELYIYISYIYFFFHLIASSFLYQLLQLEIYLVALIIYVVIYLVALGFGFI